MPLKWRKAWIADEILESAGVFDVNGDVAGNGRMDIVLENGWLECPKDPWRTARTACTSSIMEGPDALHFLLAGSRGCPAASMVNTALHDLAARIPGYRCVSSKGRRDIGDAMHFDAAFLRTLGLRYASAWLSLVEVSEG